ncbi:PRD domain-containing protein [Ligilactobacillus agilis]|uniref:PRD domain-containing protein n=1 Tax=Ligilactobacillus agilis TaxID=1601 RepID=UPI00311A5306
MFIGAGLGYKKKVGDSVDEDKIEHTFIMQESGVLNKLSNLIATVPVEYTRVVGDIIKHAERCLNYEFTDMLYVTLLDHIYNLVDLWRQGIILHNKMFFELKRLYPEEMQVALWSVDLINQKLQVKVQDEEAANIVMHFITSRRSNPIDVTDVVSNTSKIHDILELVRIYNHLDLSRSSLALDRFTIHLNFLLKRLSLDQKGRQVKDIEEDFLEKIREKDILSYKTAMLIGDYLGKSLTSDELFYLSLHVRRLLDEYKENS